ncbi:MAG: sugar phosphate isomerase/epimerase [Acidobacteriaceae bacterium]|nr:sugar phosphate isomerase/epimerase [Acidobacteriaceae bacterium]
MIHSRREFGKIALASLPVSKLLAQKVDGVQLGVCTYSFRTLPHARGGDAVDAVIQAMEDCGAKDCELFSPQLEPANPLMGGSRPPQLRANTGGSNSPEAKKAREELRQWRLNTPADHFHMVRKRFDDAGINIFAYTLNFRDDFTDEELEKCFEQTKALGARVIASSTQLTVAQRVAPFAEKHRQVVALHGHSKVGDPNEFSSPGTFEKALKMSDWFRINLDIGHFTAAGFDPVAYIEQQHDKITHLHIKDRKRNDGPNEPFGQGDTPIKQVLSLLAQKQYTIPAFIEYEYKGTGTPVEEVKKCLAYEEAALHKNV